MWTANATLPAAWNMSGIPSRMAALMVKERDASLGVNALLTFAEVKISFPAFFLEMSSLFLVLFRNTHPLPAQTKEAFWERLAKCFPLQQHNLKSFLFASLFIHNTSL